MADEGRKPQDLRDSTRNFALRVIKLYTQVPRKTECQVIGKQLLRCGTSVGANYREGLRSRSPGEYASKMNISLMELEETLYWVELLEAAAVFPAARLLPLRVEIGELSAIFVTLVKRAKGINKARRERSDSSF